MFCKLVTLHTHRSIQVIPFKSTSVQICALHYRESEGNVAYCRKNCKSTKPRAPSSPTFLFSLCDDSFCGHHWFLSHLEERKMNHLHLASLFEVSVRTESQQWHRRPECLTLTMDLAMLHCYHWAEIEWNSGMEVLCHGELLCYRKWIH